MDKLILKTILITWLAILLACIVTFTCLSLFFPMTLSNMFFNMGANNLSVTFAERAYEKDKNINNLSILIDRSIFSDDYTVLDKYGAIFVGHNDFAEFCEKQDAGKPQGAEFSYRGYIYGSVSIAKYEKQGIVEALSFAKGSRPPEIDGKVCYSFLGGRVIENGDKPAAAALKERLESFNNLDYSWLITELGKI